MILSLVLMFVSGCGSNVPFVTATVLISQPTLTDTKVPTVVPTATLTVTNTPNPTATETPLPTATPDPLNVFVDECKAPGSVDISCIYVEGILKIHLRRGDADAVPNSLGWALVWNGPWSEGQVVGILAHDGLEGQKFYQLHSGVIIYLIRTDGSVEKYLVQEQAEWRNLGNWLRFEPWNGGPEVSDVYLVNKYFRGGNNFDKMVLQTCVGNDTGIFFVTAYRVK